MNTCKLGTKLSLSMLLVSSVLKLPMSIPPKSLNLWPLKQIVKMTIHIYKTFMSFPPQ